jgi:hypothetical protein
MKKLKLKTVLFAGILTISSNAFAGLMLETYSSGAAAPNNIGGYEMTDFSLNLSDGLSSSVTSPISGEILFRDNNGNSIDLTRDSADDLWWWNNGESVDNNTYTTADYHWIELVLPENTRAFSFNIGANMNAGGWLEGIEDDSNGNILHHNFGLIGQNNTPGFGIYATNDNGGGNCSAISSVIVDPTFLWGVGNFSINQDACSTSVPEPSILALFSIGALGISLATFTRRKKSAK